MAIPLALGILEQLRDAIEKDERLTGERLLIAVLAMLSPAAALDAARRCLETALDAADCAQEQRAAARRIMAEALDSSRTRPFTQLHSEGDELDLGPAAAPLLHDALDEFLHAGRAPRDPIVFVPALWRCLHACVGAEVEADDARRNPSEWSRESAEREEAFSADEANGRTRRLQHLRASSERRMADSARWDMTRRSWLRVVDELRTAAL